MDPSYPPPPYSSAPGVYPYGNQYPPPPPYSQYPPPPPYAPQQAWSPPHGVQPSPCPPPTAPTGFLPQSTAPPQPSAPPQLYPQLPQPDLVPSRPAPPPPRLGLHRPPPPAGGLPSIGFGEALPQDADSCGPALPAPAAHGSHPSYCSSSPFQDTPLPPSLQEVWQCGGARLYFLQHDGYVLTPTDEVFFKVYLNPEFDYSSCPPRRASVSSRGQSPQGTPGSNTPIKGPTPPRTSPPGDTQQYSVVVEFPRVCRVKLSPSRGHAFLTSAKDFIAFVDEGTKPYRSVVVALPSGLDQQLLQELLTLLSQHASLTTDSGGVLTTVSSSVESAFNYSSRLGSELLKEHVPGFAKSTKVIRKGAGNLVRLGGSLVSMGASLVAETVAPTPKEDKLAEFDPMVNQLKAAIAAVRDQLAKGSVTCVTTPRGL